MIVRCENCQTEFALDDGQVGPEGVTVRCSVCAYVFKVKPAAGSSSDQPWQIQTTEDLLFTAPDLATLRQWIEQGRLHPDDKVSRTGNHWLALGEMPEFATMFPGYKGLPKVFQAVDSPTAKKPDSERSAVDELGPPPDFGSDAPKISAGASNIDDEETTAATGRPTSPLDAVTKHAVRPITNGGLDGAAAAARAGRSESSRSDVSDAWDDDSIAHGSRGGSNWKLWAALGVVSAVALLFGLPQTRAMILGGNATPVEGTDGKAEPMAAQSPELSKAQKALRSLGVAEVSRAEAAIQRALDSGAEGPTLAMLKLAQADLLVSRSLAYTIAGAIDEAQHDALIKKADDDLDRASRIFDKIEQAPDGNRMSMVRARLRLAQGRDDAEILALLPEAGAEEMQLAVEASVLWRQPDAKLPSNLIGRLQALEEPTALGMSVLAIALQKSGDATAAGEVADKLLAAADDQPVGLAIRKPGEAVPEPEDTGDTGGQPEPAAETGDPEPEPEPEPTPSTGGDTKAATGGGSGGGSGGGGGGGGFGRLLEKGCQQVEKGQASAGVSTLLKAFDRKPKDLDVLVCLGKGYEKMGNKQRALHFYERALAQSPRHRSALRGAASVAAAIGSKGTALKYYKRLLQVDPMNAKAKIYVEKHEGGGGGGGGGEQPKPKPEPKPDGGGGEQPPPAPGN